MPLIGLAATVHRDPDLILLSSQVVIVSVEARSSTLLLLLHRLLTERVVLVKIKSGMSIGPIVPLSNHGTEQRQMLSAAVPALPSASCKP